VPGVSQVWDVLAWWLVLQLFALAVLPAVLRIFRNLPDAGWAFARPVGLLFVGFLFWHGATFGLLSNAWPSILGTLLVVAALCWALAWREVVGLAAFVRQRRRTIVATEALFSLAFLAWVAVRAFDPDITATEKPMELLFLNGVLRSEQFPPIDPWLSGYAISYYYFGYLLTGMIARLAAAPAEIAFNLMLPTLFALTATGAFAIGASLGRTLRSGLLAAGLVLLVANLEPVFEILNANGMLSPGLQQSLEIKDMPGPHDAPGLFPADNWWWFRATRVVGTPNGSLDYTINEFPFFSFVLGDMHPHVLALPFLFVAVGFALNLLLTAGGLSLSALRRDPWTVLPVGVLFGAVGFLNTWDMPTMLFVLAGAFALHRLVDRGVVDRRLVREVLYGAVGALLLCIVLYLPFYLVFRSQAGGLGVVVTKTQLKHFALFWGPMYLLTATFLLQQLSETWQQVPRESWTRSAAVWGGTVLLAAIAIVLSAPVVGLTLPLLVAALALASRHLFAPALPAIEPVDELPEPVHRRTRRAEPHPVGTRIAGGALPVMMPREHLFALLLAFTGLLLIMGTELVFIRDHFGNRMNTVFKLYYQAWMLLALAGAYAVPFLLERARGVPGRLWGGVLAALFGVTLLYPIGATLDKTNDFSRQPTLDGIAFWGRVKPDELPAIRWLQANVAGTPVIVEATGGSYRQEFGRFSSMTGLPTVLGWEGHEGQWRGRVEDADQRKRDIDTIYRSTDQRQVLSTMAKYRAEYLAVGQTERDTYGRQANLDRYSQFMDVAFRQGSVTIYRVRGA
jgi:YYY domain-containing protein